MADHGRAVDKSKRLAGIAGGSHAGGNDGNDIHDASP